MKILVSGGTGFIGSHTVVELMEAGHEVVIFDNFYNSKPEALDNIAKITGRKPSFYKVDMLDKGALESVFRDHRFDCVIHFAGYKAVGESVQKPLMYFENNIQGTINLLNLMGKYGVKNLIFSSSATVYGFAEKMPIKEDFPLSVSNPYGRTKLVIEDILRDYCVADKEFSAVLLRYFNPVGAHESALLHEDPNGIPNNLMPRIIQAAKGEIDHLSVFGNDYPTKDGTCIRDYIHVVDLARGHVCALNYVVKHKGAKAINLGTGNGVTVLELISTFERVNNVKVPYEIVGRRPGDAIASYADNALAKELLGWDATHTVEDMCRDAMKGACSQA